MQQLALGCLGIQRHRRRVIFQLFALPGVEATPTGIKIKNWLWKEEEEKVASSFLLSIWWEKTMADGSDVTRSFPPPFHMAVLLPWKRHTKKDDSFQAGIFVYCT